MIRIHIPWWVWAILIVGAVVLSVQAMRTENPTGVTAVIKYWLFLWARSAQAPPQQQRRITHHRREEAPTTTAGGCSRGEEACRLHMEMLFGVPFAKARPSFMRNPVTGENLELDVYNEDLRLAVEYNGRQHYQFNSHFHNGSNDRFQNQQYRDLIKKQLCEQNGVRLIIVPYTVPLDQIGPYIDNQLSEAGLSA